MSENLDPYENIGRPKNPVQGEQQFVAETWLTFCDWRGILPPLVDHLASAGGCASAAADGPMQFGDGLVWTRLTSKDLFIQVLANDILTLLGLQVMVEVYLQEISQHRPFDLHWHPKPQPVVLASR